MHVLDGLLSPIDSRYLLQQADFKVEQVGMMVVRRGLWAVFVLLASIAAACGGSGSPADNAEVDAVDNEAVVVEEVADDTTSTTAVVVEEVVEEQVPDLGNVVLFTSNAPGEDPDVDDVIAGLEAGSETVGFQLDVVVEPDWELHEDTVREIASAEPNLVVVLRDTQGNNAVSEFPDTGFLYLGDGFRGSTHVNSLYPDHVESGYLAGVYAASLSETGTIGYVGGRFVRSWEVQVAFAEGAQSINPSIEVLQFGESFPSETRDASANMFAAGADVVLVHGDGGNVTAAIEAAAEAGALALAMPWEAGDVVSESQENVALVIEPDWNTVVSGEVAVALGGERERRQAIRFSNGNQSFEIDQRFVDAAGEVGARAAALAPTLDEVVSQMVSGELEVRATDTSMEFRELGE